MDGAGRRAGGRLTWWACGPPASRRPGAGGLDCRARRRSVRRNLLITQYYHDLSVSLRPRLGAEHANWCTFATWASRTAGRFIRDEEVPTDFLRTRRLGARAARHRAGKPCACARELGGDHPEGHRPRHRPADRPRGRRADHRGESRRLQRARPVFSRTIEALDEDADGAAVLRICAGLTGGASERGGQTRLRLALAGYARARAEPDPHRGGAHAPGERAHRPPRAGPAASRSSPARSTHRSESPSSTPRTRRPTACRAACKRSAEGPCESPSERRRGGGAPLGGAVHAGADDARPSGRDARPRPAAPAPKDGRSIRRYSTR